MPFEVLLKSEQTRKNRPTILSISNNIHLVLERNVLGYFVTVMHAIFVILVNNIFNVSFAKIS